jgi:hypothetical protein
VLASRDTARVMSQENIEVAPLINTKTYQTEVLGLLS